MSDQELLELCARITDESDSQKLSLLLEELLELLKEEQDAIRAKIKANLTNYRGDVPY